MNAINCPKNVIRSAQSRPMSLQDVLFAMAADTSLSPSRRADLKSAIKQLCRFAGVIPCDAPASVAWIRGKASQLHPLQVPSRRPITRKRLENILSSASAATRIYAAGRSRRRSRTSLLAPWSELWDRLPDSFARYRVFRFLTFLSEGAYTVADVRQDCLEEFRNWLKASTTTKEPDKVLKNTVRAWNAYKTSIPGWPPVTFADSWRYVPYTTPWEELPPSLTAEAERMFARWRAPDLLDEHGPRHALREATIDARKFQIRQAHAALIASGVDPLEITSLSGIARPDRMKLVLRFLLARNGNEPSSLVAGAATALTLIAEHWIQLPAADIKVMRDLTRKVTPKHPGMTPRNAEALGQFESERNKRLLVNLPQRVIEPLRRKNHLSRREALECQGAAAMAILLCLPIRRKNLVSLDLERHFLYRPEAKGQRVFIVLTADEVKTREAIEFELHPWALEVVQFYLNRARPLLASDSSSWLFPGERPGCHKAPERLADTVNYLIYRRTGLKMTLHRFRHVVGKIILDDDPTQFELVRRALGHKRLDTTMRTYVGYGSRAASKILDKALGQYRAENRHV